MDGVDPIAESDTFEALSGLFPDARPGRRLGDFTLLKRLGRGAQGDVYEARQESLGRLVALKILAPHLTLNPDRVQRFRREAEAGGRLGHPNIVGVHAVGASDGFHFIVQELVAGGRTLGDRIVGARNEADLPRDWYETTAQLFVQVADALHVAHEAGIVHRDVKPGNILITKPGVPKVADFGLAMVLDDLHRSLSGELIGTPFYMSPEQTSARREGLDRRTDVFSLGVTLYESLTLWRPFDAENREGIVEQIRLHDPREPRRLRTSVPRDLSVICMKAMEKRPERRYQTAGEVADELRRFLRHEPILARPPGPVLRAAKWVRRHPVASATGSVTLAALVVVSALLVETRAAWKDADIARGELSEALAAETKAVGEKQGALVRAEEEAERARQEERTHKLVADVMGQVVLDNPVLLRHFANRGRGWEVFRRSVDRLAELADSLRSMPDAQSYVLLVAGTAYSRLAIPDRADELLTRAYSSISGLGLADDRAEDLGRRAANLATCALELGKLRAAQGRPDEAETLLRQALALHEQQLSATDPQTLKTLAELGAFYLAQGRLEDADLALMRFGLGASQAGSHELSLWSLQLTGQLRLLQGRLDEAEPMLTAVLDQSAAFMPDYEIRQAGLWLMDLYRRRADQAADPATASAARESISIVLAELLRRHRQTAPDDNLETARLEMELGASQRQAKRLAEARPHLERALAICLDLAGPDDYLTLCVRHNLASLDYAEGRPDAAESGWREIVAADARSPQANRAPVFSALKLLGELACQRGDYDGAEQCAAQLADATPADHPKHAEAESLLVRIRQEREAARQTASSPIP